MDWIFPVGGILVVIFVVYLVNSGKKRAEDNDKIIQSYYEKYKFNPVKSYFYYMWTNGIAYDQQYNKFLYFTNIGEEDEKVELINPSSIIETKLLENGETVTRTSRGSQIVSGTIAGLLAGGIGLVVGLLTGKQYSDKNVNELKLELVLNDPLNPIRRITFMYNASGMKQNSDKYKEHYENAYYWFKLIEILIHQESNKNHIL